MPDPSDGQNGGRFAHFRAFWRGFFGFFYPPLLGPDVPHLLAEPTWESGFKAGILAGLAIATFTALVVETLK